MGVKKIVPAKKEEEKDDVVVVVEDNEDTVVVVEGDENKDADVVLETPENITPDTTEENDSDVVVEPVVEEKKEDAPEVTVVVDTQSKPIEAKKVKIRPNANHKCSIGGEWYFLIKGEVISVPENVKDVLAEANLLAPL